MKRKIFAQVPRVVEDAAKNVVKNVVDNAAGDAIKPKAPDPPKVPKTGEGDNDSKDSKEDKSKFKLDLNSDTPGGPELRYYIEFNELANTFKDVFGITDPVYTNPEKLRERFLKNSAIARDPAKILDFIRQIKDTLFAISSYKVYEPNIAKLLAYFAIRMLDRTRDFSQVTKKLADIQEKASDTEKPRDGYIISLLRGNVNQANLLLLLSDVATGVSKATLQQITENQQLANKMLGSKSQELINAQYLDNQLAAANAAEIQRSLAAYQALIPIAAQRARWRQDVNRLAESIWKSKAARDLLKTPTVMMLGAALGGFEQFKVAYKMPIKSLFKGDK